MFKIEFKLNKLSIVKSSGVSSGNRGQSGAHRYRYKNTGLDAQELRRRRQKESVRQRRQKRERELCKLRNSATRMQTRIRNELYDNLKLLSFETFLIRRKQTFQLKPDSLKKLSQNEFQTITYFLFETLNSEECERKYKACYPVLDRKQESEFRQITLKWLQQIKSQEIGSHFPRVVPIYFQNPSGKAFYHLYLEFSNYVMIQIIDRIASLESIECDLNDNNDINLIRNETKVHLNEYQKTKLEIENETQKWINEMQYFIDTKHELSESIQTSDQKKVEVFKMIQFKCREIKSDEQLVHYFNQLQTNVQELRNTLILLNKTWIKNWKFYLNSLESQTNSSLYSSIDLKDSFDCVVENFVFRLQSYDTLIEKVQNGLVAFIEVSSTLPNEAKAYRNQLIAIKDKFNPIFNQLKCSVERKRSELLKNAAIIERRKWFEERIPDLTQINFKFQPKNRDSVTSQSSHSKEAQAQDESPSPSTGSMDDLGVF